MDTNTQEDEEHVAGEDPQIAAKLVAEEEAMLRQLVKQSGHTYWTNGPFPDVPDDGAGTFINFALGARDNLTKSSARRQAEIWRQATRRYPRADFYVHLLGYNEDPREIWDIVEAARYVRWWSRYAGIRELGDMKVTLLAGGIAVLAACGCFGNELRDVTLLRHRQRCGAPVKQN